MARHKKCCRGIAVATFALAIQIVTLEQASAHAPVSAENLPQCPRSARETDGEAACGRQVRLGRNRAMPIRAHLFGYSVLLTQYGRALPPLPRGAAGQAERCDVFPPALPARRSGAIRTSGASKPVVRTRPWSLAAALELLCDRYGLTAIASGMGGSILGGRNRFRACSEI